MRFQKTHQSTTLLYNDIGKVDFNEDKGNYLGALLKDLSKALH